MATGSNGIRVTVGVVIMVVLAVVGIAIAASVRGEAAQRAEVTGIETRLRVQETTAARMETRQEVLIEDVRELKATSAQILKEVRSN